MANWTWSKLKFLLIKRHDMKRKSLLSLLGHPKELSTIIQSRDYTLAPPCVGFPFFTPAPWNHIPKYPTHRLWLHVLLPVYPRLKQCSVQKLQMKSLWPGIETTTSRTRSKCQALYQALHIGHCTGYSPELPTGSNRKLGTKIFKITQLCQG